ncbi:MAG: inositol monophosphatase [Candidatus Thermofonsia Clade 1 bacterium]|uniref:Inositol-1-monophosphatase n=1 Tax=Candidatus Thermofonsia Clade 1 bacterium TaxID=2364210 RepID=A0A2M8P131_9CHLR|nr:MAG: inositol monophosphatase [Candidatus Thermofonsia Clade 1 bacterium]
MSEPLDLAAALSLAEDAARRAAELLRSYFRHPKLKIQRKGATDLVTEADQRSEALIAQMLLSAYPDHALIGEEGGIQGNSAANYRWHVDPLDGTTNFAHQIPFFAVSIALSDANNVPLVGVVYDPIQEECFTALRGGGARLGRKKLRVSKTRKLAEALVASGFPHDKRVNPDNNTEEWACFVPRTQSVRRLGSAALELCYVAAGRLDGYWEARTHTWDILAGLLMVEESGGKLSNYRGRQEGVYEGVQVVASNGHIHEEMLEVLILGAAAPRP